MQFCITSSGADSDAPLACRRIVIPMILVAIGTALGLLSIALVSNRFGNTDWVGLLLFPLAGGIFATGVAHLFLRLPSSALLGIASTPIWAVAPFVFYWAFFFATAFQNRHHQDFAVNGVSQIAPAAQMNELFKDCRHYITYGAITYRCSILLHTSVIGTNSLCRFLLRLNQTPLCLLYTSPSPRDQRGSRMPSSA